jgi:hypothetical protein
VSGSTCRDLQPRKVDLLSGPKLRCADAESGVEKNAVAPDVTRDVAEAGGVDHDGRDDRDGGGE